MFCTETEDHPATFMAKICYPSVLLGRWWVFVDVKMMAWGYVGSMALVQWLYIHDIIVSYTDMITCTYSHLWLCYMTSSLAVPFNIAFSMSQQNRRFKSLILNDMLIDFYLCFLPVTCEVFFFLLFCMEDTVKWRKHKKPLNLANYSLMRSRKFSEWRAGRVWVIPTCSNKGLIPKA